MLKNVNDHVVICDNEESGYHPVFIVIVILLIHASIFINNHEAILNQITLRDFDGYWHLLRVESLYHTGNLYDTIIPRSNAPYGEHLHWTRAFDLILYAGAYVGSFFVGFNAALFWWSMFVNPILHICSFLVLFWGVRDLIGDARASLFGIIFPFQPEITSVFMPGIPDHHGALLFIFSLFIVLFIKSILNDNLKILSICGIVGGISLWFSIENIVIVLIAFSVLGFAWVVEGKPFQSKNILFSFTLLISTLLTMFVDTRFDDLMKVVYDRRSIVHVFLWLTITFFWIVIFFVSRYSKIFEKKISRIFAAIFGVFVCIFLMHELFPLFFRSPLTEVDPVVKSIYLNQTTEFTGLFSANSHLPKSAIVYWAMTLPAIPISSFFVWHSFDREKKVWLFIMIVNIFFIVWSALTYRMITYAFLCALIPLSYLLYLPFAYIQNNVDQPYNALVRSFYIIVCCFGLFILPVKMFSSSSQGNLLRDGKFLLQFSRYLNEDKFFKEEKRRTLTSMYMGPLILYKTPHEVIGTPSHRNVSGILDTYHVMNALNESDAHVIIQRRGIQVIIIGRPESGIGDYFIQDDKAKNDMGEIFHHQLWKGNVPRWLQIYPVPKSLQGKIKVFLVLE